MSTTETPRRDFHELYVFLSAWRSSNKAHQRIEYRWLADIAGQLEQLTACLKEKGAAGLSDDDQQRFRDFRAGEIAEEKALLDKQRAVLDAELAKLTNAKPSARAA